LGRLFTTFPAGVPGIALLLFRSSVAATILLTAIRSCDPPAAGLVIVAILACVLLCLGVLTPIVAALGCAFQFLSLLPAGHPDSSFLILAGLNAALAVMLGPGAYSCDARLFGRRLVVF
jgi:hypothetical protein